MKKVALFIIDPQNDFCLPTGALYVKNAEHDMDRLSNFIDKNVNKIDYIAITQDSHHVIDISHPNFWMDKDGKNPNPFTIITSKDIENGIWSPRFFPQEAVKYINQLESQNEFPHCIWPEHCIIGSEGAAIYGQLMDSIIKWSKKGKFYGVFTKGTYPLTEHFGALRANVEITGRPETQLNQDLIKILEKYDEIYISGEAKSHCVCSTLRQVMDLDFTDLAKKIIILDDCMSPVPGFETIADPIYERARKMDIKFVKSTDITL